MVKLQYTTASAVKEKEGKLLCQPEVLCDGKTKTCIAQCSVQFLCLIDTQNTYHPNIFFHNILVLILLFNPKMYLQVWNYPGSIMTSTARSTDLST